MIFAAGPFCVAGLFYAAEETDVAVMAIEAPQAIAPSWSDSAAIHPTWTILDA